MNKMSKKKKSLTIDVSDKKSSKSFKTASEHSGNRYLTISKIKNSTNSLNLSNHKKGKFDSFNNVEPEKLYENNIHLRQEINKLKKELEEVKYQLVRKDLELKAKDEIIKSCLKDFNLDSDRKNLSNKAEESVLLSNVKNKYQDLKTMYESKCAENKILRANIKLTKLNEFEIENDTLKKELNKLNSLYLSSIEDNKNINKEFNEFKEKFLMQHALISQLQEQIESLNDKNNKLKNEKDNIERDYENNIIIQKKLEKSNDKLKKRSLRFLIQKKRKENYQIKNDKKIEELIKSEKKFKDLYNQLLKDNDSLRRQYMNMSPQKENNKNIFVQQSRFKSISHIEIESEAKTNDKFELYKSLYEENKIKNVLYERYFKEHKVKPEDIIKKDFKGILNSENNVFLLERYSRNNKDEVSFFDLLKNFLKNSTNKNKKEIKLKLKLNNRNIIPNNSKTVDINTINNNNDIKEEIKEEEDKK